MSSSRRHNEWLSLIDISGPFLSVPVLDGVFPQGLDAHDPDHARLLKLAFEEREVHQPGERPDGDDVGLRAGGTAGDVSVGHETDDSLKRDFYAEICRVERWNTRTLRRKIGHSL
jgi:hypothetical protein